MIQWLTGPGQGRKATFTQKVVTLGRDAGNSLVVDQSFVSRRHGEIRLENDQWVLVNQSPNGTKVNRTLVTDKPCALKAGDVVRIGDIDIFEVGFVETSATGQHAAAMNSADDDGKIASQAGTGGKASLSRRTKLWVGLIIWWVVMLGGFVFFMTLDEKPGTSQNAETQALSNQQIEQVLIREIESAPTSAVDYRRHIEEGRALAGSLTASRSNLYKAYREYRNALSVAENRRFADDLDQLTYENLQREIVQQTQERYRQAYARLRTGQYATAATEFSRLADDLYHLFRLDRQNLLVENVQKHEQDARTRAGKKK